MSLSFLLLSLACSTESKQLTDPQDTSAGTSVDPGDCPDDRAFFDSEVADLVESRCVGCHVEGGVAAETRLLLKAED